MSEAVGYYPMLFSMLHFMNLQCWRSFYELSDPLELDGDESQSAQVEEGRIQEGVAWHLKKEA
jgi:hypothetical protein